MGFASVGLSRGSTFGYLCRHDDVLKEVGTAHNSNICRSETKANVLYSECPENRISINFMNSSTTLRQTKGNIKLFFPLISSHPSIFRLILRLKWLHDTKWLSTDEVFGSSNFRLFNAKPSWAARESNSVAMRSVPKELELDIFLSWNHQFWLRF